MGVLEMLGYEVMHLIDGDDIMPVFLQFDPDIVILDVMLNAKLDGFQVAKQIRLESNTPIVFTTSRSENEDFETAFTIANTDYVRKPYRLAEVQMRMENLLTRQETVTEAKPVADTIVIGNYSFYPLEQVLMNDIKKIHLNKNESAVLTILNEHIHHFVSRDEIVKAVWNVSDPIAKEGSLNNILTNLRKILKNDQRIIVETRVGIGVRMTINLSPTLSKGEGAWG